MVKRDFKRVVLWGAAALLLVQGCVTSHESSKGIFADAPDESSPQLSSLSAGDTLELSVEVDGNMEVVSHSAQINSQGMITLPLVGDVSVAGGTLDAARQVIATTYSAYYVSTPLVMLALMTGSEAGEWGAITVTGRIARPGRVLLRSQQGMNITEVIQQAGGFAGSAKTSAIQVTRFDKDGRKRQVFVDYKSIGRGGDASADIKLIAGDMVHVPERIF